MLTVWSLCWGDKYTDYHVQRLQREVRRRLIHPHRFICITDRTIEGVATMPPPTDYLGWWGKVGLFKPGIATTRNIWLDLDVVITGSLDYLVYYTDKTLAAPNNWAQSGHGGVQSSVMVWGQNKHVHQIYRDFKPEWAVWPPVNKPGQLWGDQEWVTHLRDSGKLDVTPLPNVVSYKYHCRNGLPANTRIVVFHGDPKPETVRESWFKW